MTYILLPHPYSREKAVSAIKVDAARISERLVDFRFALSCRPSNLRLPPITPSKRQDRLWQTTCFEIFVTLPTGYCEYNFAPSEAWASYVFAEYRQGMVVLEGVEAPAFSQDAGSDWYEFEGHFQLPEFPLTFVPAMGFSAVIEETDGTKSYWALAHAPGPPDFHNPACFTATLPAPAGT